MPVRKTTAVVSVLGLGALALVGCSAAPQTAESCGRVAVTDDALAGAEVSGEIGADLAVDLPASFRSAHAGHADVTTGDGALIESMGQSAVLDVALVDPATGVSLPVNASGGDETQVFPLSAFLDLMPGLESSLECASEGSTFVASLGEKGFSDDFAQQAQLAFAQQVMTESGGGETPEVPDPESLVAVVEVHRVLPASADGSPVYNAAFGMPSVVRDPDGVPGVTIPDAAAPTEQTTQTLLQGDGEKVAESDVVTLQYTSVGWATRAVTTSTWQSGAPTTTTIDQLPPGFAEAITGAQVGSQILTVVPGSDGDATVSVIDVLGTVPAA